MKKILSVVLATAMMLSMTINAFAAGTQSGSSTVTAVVPEPTYNIHIPADMTLDYGVGLRHEVGKVSVSDVNYFPDKLGIVVQITPTSLKSTNGDEIPVVFEWQYKGDPGYTVVDFREPFLYVQRDEEYKIVNLYATVTEADWKAAKPGTYTSTITYDFRIF